MFWSPFLYPCSKYTVAYSPRFLSKRKQIFLFRFWPVFETENFTHPATLSKVLINSLLLRKVSCIKSCFPFSSNTYRRNIEISINLSLLHSTDAASILFCSTSSLLAFIRLICLLSFLFNGIHDLFIISQSCLQRFRELKLDGFSMIGVLGSFSRTAFKYS